MTDQNNILLLFLQAFKQELIKVAENLPSKTMKRSEIDKLFVYKGASNEEKAVIQEMVSKILPGKAIESTTGQDDSVEVENTNQLPDNTDGNDVGKAKTYASGHFHSDKEAA
jgi:hypothetical protein